ncbi:hypothetical protein SDC9_143079 [bioreactor metagenome]|uniref:Uncharacterized protein n=1 Tax=bioreactor metagenome TaxID=1076179 RepID=A0A645E536_9ZZZZ
MVIDCIALVFQLVSQAKFLDSPGSTYANRCSFRNHCEDVFYRIVALFKVGGGKIISFQCFNDLVSQCFIMPVNNLTHVKNLLEG